MGPQVSQRALRLQPAATLAITAEAKARQARGEDIVNFGAGEPDFDTPTWIKDAAVAALDRGFTKYTATGGTPELRAAVAAYVAREQGLSYQPNEVLVSVGAKQSLFNLCLALLDPGDEALIPTPYWLSYPAMVEIAGARPRFLPTRAEEGYQLSRSLLESQVSDRTRLLFVNSPNNPTGAVLGEAALREVVAFLEAHPDITLASDDIYERLLYRGARFRNVLTLAPQLRERVVLVSGFSKTFSMTGWRVGYALGPAALIAAMQKIQDQSTSNPTSFAQSGALAALTAPPAQVDAALETMRQAFERRRDRIVARLRAMPGLDFPEAVEPRGAFYALPSIAPLLGRQVEGTVVAGGESFCRLLLARGVAAIPGEPFGAPNRVRFSFVLGEADLERGMDRVAKLVADLA